MDTSPDGLVSSYFEKEGDRVTVDLETVFLLLDDNESQFSTPLNHHTQNMICHWNTRFSPPFIRKIFHDVVHEGGFSRAGLSANQ